MRDACKAAGGIWLAGRCVYLPSKDSPSDPSTPPSGGSGDVGGSTFILLRERYLNTRNEFVRALKETVFPITQIYDDNPVITRPVFTNHDYLGYRIKSGPLTPDTSVALEVGHSYPDLLPNSHMYDGVDRKDGLFLIELDFRYEYTGHQTQPQPGPGSQAGCMHVRHVDVDTGQLIQHPTFNNPQEFNNVVSGTMYANAVYFLEGYTVVRGQEQVQVNITSGGTSPNCDVVTIEYKKEPERVTGRGDSEPSVPIDEPKAPSETRPIEPIIGAVPSFEYNPDDWWAYIIQSSPLFRKYKNSNSGLLVNLERPTPSGFSIGWNLLLLDDPDVANFFLAKIREFYGDNYNRGTSVSLAVSRRVVDEVFSRFPDAFIPREDITQSHIDRADVPIEDILPSPVTSSTIHPGDGSAILYDPNDPDLPPNIRNYIRRERVTSDFDYSRTACFFKNPFSGSSILTGGTHVGFDGNCHIVNYDGGTVYRYITTGIFPIEYREYLTVESGRIPNSAHEVHQGTDPVDNHIRLTTSSTPHRPDSSEYRTLFRKSVPYGRISLELDYSAYIQVPGDAISRARFKVHLVKFDSAGSTCDIGSNCSIVDTLVDTMQNIGDKTTNYAVSNGMKLHKDYDNLPPGDYGIVLDLEDLYEDNNRDDDGIFFYGSVEYSFRLPSTVDTGDLIDDWTKALVTVRDATNGRVLFESTVDGGASGVLVDYVIPPDSAYEISYTLWKPSCIPPNCSESGTMRICGGSVVEEIELIDPEDTFTHGSGITFEPGDIPGWDPFPEGSGTLLRRNRGRWFWFDIVRIEKPPQTIVFPPNITYEYCDPEGTKIEFVSSTPGTEGHFNETHPVETGRNYLQIENPYSYPVEVTYKVTSQHPDCEGNPMYHFHNGTFGFRCTDSCPEECEPSYFLADNFYVRRREPNWVDGSGDSYFRVCIISSLGDVECNEFHSNGNAPIPFTINVPPDFGDDFQITVDTVQEGEIIEHLDFRSWFNLRKLVIYSYFWIFPNPFDSNLCFYINDELQECFYDRRYYERCYPVSAGENTYKWVFTTDQEDGLTWDYARIHWIRVTNWTCDEILITPYCEPGGGDICIEALITCLIQIVTPEPEPEPDPDDPDDDDDEEETICVIGSMCWIFT